MRSFTSLAVLALGALTALTSAAPAPIPVQGSRTNAVVARAGEVKGLPSIFADITAKAGPLCTELKFLTGDNATTDGLNPIADELKSIFTAAQAEINQLVGKPIEEILKAVEGDAQVSVDDLAKTVGDLITLVFDAISGVLNVVTSGNFDALKTLLADIANVLGDVILSAVHIVDDLVGPLLKVAFKILPVVIKLGVSIFQDIFGI